MSGALQLNHDSGAAPEGFSRLHRGQKSSFLTSKRRGKPRPGNVFVEQWGETISDNSPLPFLEEPHRARGCCWSLGDAGIHLPLLTETPQSIPALPGSSAHPQHPSGSCLSRPPKPSLGSPLVPHQPCSPRLGLWGCPCGFEGLSEDPAWLGSCRRTPGTRNLHFKAD